MQSHTNRSLVSLVIAAAVVVVMIAATAAQSNVGVIRGMVTDFTGAVLPGVNVTLRQSGAPDRKTVTDEEGEFTFIAINPGRYEVTCELLGFATHRTTVDVAAGTTVTLAAQLVIERLEETVTVSAASPRADAQSARMIVQRQLNTEAYDRIVDNQWHEVSNRPLSTFSADVDTASYSNVRRFLNNGEAPPKDAV